MRITFNKNIKNHVFHTLICGILCLNSCSRSGEVVPIDPVDAPDSTLIDVNINSPTVGNKTIENDKYAQITADNVAAAIEIERNTESYETKLDNGNHYRVVSYRKDGDKYIFQESKDLIVGYDAKIPLNKSQNYTLIIYSLEEKNILPDLINQNDFNNASINFNPTDENSSQNLLYQRIDDFVPNGKNTLDIKLEPKVSSIRFVIDASDFYGGNISGNITELNDIKISYPKYEKAILNVSSSNNDLTYVGSDIKTLYNIRFNDEKNKKISEWKNLFIDTSKNVENITFNAKIIVNGIESDIPYKVNIKNIKYSFKQTINLKLELCGLNTTNRGWRQFMCHDLGAIYSEDPFKGSVYIHGTRYKWAGVKEVPATEDLLKKVINSWEDTVIKTDNNEEEAIWGGKNPCPDNYRILDSDELRELSKHAFIRSGKWTGDGIESGFELENQEEGKLFFPTTGFRDKIGRLYNENEETNLWARREDYMIPSEAPVLRISKDANDRVTTKVSTQSKNMGFSVRCIKKTIFDFLNKK